MSINGQVEGLLSVTGTILDNFSRFHEILRGQPHGTGAWISALLQMSVDTGVAEYTFLVFSASLRVL